MRLRRGGERDRREVGRKRGQMPLSILGIGRRGRPPRGAPARSGRARSSPHVELDPELAERGDDRNQIVGLDVLDRQLTAGDGASAAKLATSRVPSGSGGCLRRAARRR